MSNGVHWSTTNKKLATTEQGIRAWKRDVQTKLDELMKGGRLTKKGAQEAVAQDQGSNRLRFASELADAKKEHAEGRARLRGLLVQDQGEASPLDREIREYLREVGHERAMQLARQHPEVAAAILRAPGFLSGFTTDAPVRAIAESVMEPRVRELRDQLDAQAKTIERVEAEFVATSAQVGELLGETSALSGMSEQDKVAYVREHGADAFRRLMQGDPSVPQPDKRSGRPWTLEERNAYVDAHGMDALRAWDAGDPDAPWPAHLEKPEEEAA